MDPFTIFLISSGINAAATGASGFIGQLNQARSLNQQGISGMLGIKALEYQAAQQEEIMRDQQSQTLASNELSYLSSNIDPSEGSPLKVMASQAYQMEKDIQTFRYNVNMQKRQMYQESRQATKAASRLTRLAPLQAIMPMLKAGADVAGGMYKGKAAGGKQTSTNIPAASPDFMGDINIGRAGRYA